MATSPQLPVDYEAEMDDYRRKQAIAQLMFQRSLQPIQPGQVGPVAARVSPLALLAQAGTGYLSSKNEADATTGLRDVQKRADTDMRDELGKVVQNPDIKSAIAAAMQSKFPAIREWGTAKQKVLDERVNKGAEIAGKDNPQIGLDILNSGQMPSGNVIPPSKPPEFKIDPVTKLPVVINSGAGNRLTGTFGPQGTNIEVKLPGTEANDLFASRKKTLEGWQEQAKLSKGVLDANTTAIEALQEGAKVGGLEGYKQSVRKVLQGLGVDAPATAPTEQLNMALGERILANARKLAPVTREDIKQLEADLGSINTDPAALQRMLSITTAIAVRDIQNYHRFVKDSADNSTHPILKDLYGGQTIGYELPPTLPGGMHGGMSVLQELQKRGGDVSQFSAGGQPVPADAKFNITKPGFVQPPSAGKNTPLTPDEQVELEALRKKYKR